MKTFKLKEEADNLVTWLLHLNNVVKAIILFIIFQILMDLSELDLWNTS